MMEAPLKRSRRTKIVATLGPASDTPEMIEKLFHAGADVFRINMSHLAREKLPERIEVIRTIEREAKRPIGILVDLQGPKLRLGTFVGDAAVLENGQTFVLDSDPTPGDTDRVFLPHPEILSALEPSHGILIDDGKLSLIVTEVSEGRAVTRVEVGGRISNRKGVSLPHTVLPVPAMTEKDRGDLEAGLAAGADWIAVSFVQRPEDVAEVKKVAAGRALVMAKIEKPQALTRLDEIIEISDGIMVARGDLGVEMPLEQVPGVQKRILRVCRQHGKPIVIATQMLESMISAPVPTRAEASDVASAIYDGADAVMLSAESASGAYAVPAVSMMERIICEVERDPMYRQMIDAQNQAPLANSGDAICSALRDVTGIIGAVATVTFTISGHTSLRAARERPTAPILSITPHLATARRLALAWGVQPCVGEALQDEQRIVAAACKAALKHGLAKVGDQIVITAGVPFGESGTTNLLRIARIWPV